MSRKIAEKSSVTISSEENRLLDTAAGKVIFTECRQQKCAFLIKNNRLTAISFRNAADSKIGAVYIGRVKNVVKNIDACFLEIADGEVCFLPLKDVTAPYLLNRTYDGRILAGDELLVQITRDAQKTKQASVTTRLSISNDYYALELGFDRINYSAKLEKEQKERLANLLLQNGIRDEKNHLNQAAFQAEQFPGLSLKAPIGMIVRTKAGEFADAEAAYNPFLALAEELKALLLAASHSMCFCCLKRPSDTVEQMIGQLASDKEFEEIITDDEETYGHLLAYLQEHTPSKKVRLYEDKSFPLKNIYKLESKLDEALSERVWLKSGGYLVIQPTEALTVIDVNSGKYETKKDAADTARKINLEAAEEIALQLRLRNLSGIILVDFINMRQESERKELLDFMASAVKEDRLPTNVIDITPLGLMELTRKKVNKPLREQYGRPTQNS